MPEDALGELFDTVVEEMSDVSDPVVETTEPVIDDVADNADIVEADQADTPVVEPADVTEGTEEADTQEGSAEPFDWKQYADQLIPVRQDGVDRMVTLEEARNGFMRQDDYTRKTQEVAGLKSEAQWAQEVQEAFKLDPQGTLAAFAKAYNVDPAAKVSDQTDALNDLDDDVRPWAEQTVQTRRELEVAQRQLQEIQNRGILEDIRQEVRGLQERFGDDFEPENTLRMAARKNISLEDAHWFLSAQRLSQKDETSGKVDTQVAEVVAEQDAATAADVKAAKAKASSTQTRSFKASEIPADNFTDIGELAAIVMAEMGS